MVRPLRQDTQPAKLLNARLTWTTIVPPHLPVHLVRMLVVDADRFPPRRQTRQVAMQSSCEQRTNNSQCRRRSRQAAALAQAAALCSRPAVERMHVDRRSLRRKELILLPLHCLRDQRTTSQHRLCALPIRKRTCSWADRRELLYQGLSGLSWSGRSSTKRTELQRRWPPASGPSRRSVSAPAMDGLSDRVDRHGWSSSTNQTEHHGTAPGWAPLGQRLRQTAECQNFANAGHH